MNIQIATQFEPLTQPPQLSGKAVGDPNPLTEPNYSLPILIPHHSPTTSQAVKLTTRPISVQFLPPLHKSLPPNSPLDSMALHPWSSHTVKILHCFINNIHSQVLISTFPTEYDVIPTLPNAPKSKGKHNFPRGTRDMQLIISYNINR